MVLHFLPIWYYQFGMDHASILAALGGDRAVAVALTVPLVRVQRWRMRGRIPSEYWPELTAMAGEIGQEGITLSALADGQRAARHQRTPAEATA